MDVLFYILLYIINNDEEKLDSFIPRSFLQYKKGPNLNLIPQSTICSYTPVDTVISSGLQQRPGS